MFLVRNKTFVSIFIFVVFVFYATTRVFAQSSGFINQSVVDDTKSNTDFTLTPAHPAPGDEVTLDVYGYAKDFDRAYIKYSINGNEFAKGYGLKSITFKAGKAGEKTVIDVDFLLANSYSFTKQFSITPVEIALAWEADTYTPPLYQGKALFTDQSTVKIVAYVNGNTDTNKIDPTRMVYSWKKNGTLLDKESGIGKNILIVDGDKSLLSYTDITLTVDSYDKSISSQKKISINSARPEIIFYQSDPLEGTRFENQLENTILTKNNLTVVGIPYFLSINDLGNPLLSYVWSLNNTPIKSNGLFVSLLKPETAGSSRINLETSVIGKLFQKVNNTLTINYEK